MLQTLQDAFTLCALSALARDALAVSVGTLTGVAFVVGYVSGSPRPAQPKTFGRRG